MSIRFFIICFIAGISTAIAAHPGTGIVTDSKGNVYYTDLKHIYKVNQDGDRSIVVRDVHSHELYMDLQDNLYGEHLWYNGEALDTWGHYVWQLHADGRLDTIRPPSPGFLKEYSFARDAAGNMYWIGHADTMQIVMRDTSGAHHIILRGVYPDARNLYSTREGMLYFSAGDKIYRIHASDPDESASLVAQIHQPNLFGIWIDPVENAYVASYGGQCIVKLDTNGLSAIVFTSEGDWAPTGGVFDKFGNLWVLEYNAANQARVHKVVELKKSSPALHKRNETNIAIPILLLLTGSFAALLLLTKLARKKSGNN